jgi:hypothetical protein
LFSLEYNNKPKRSVIMSTATIAQSNQLNNHALDMLVEKTVGVLKLSIVQGMNAQMNPAVYKLRPKNITVGARGARELPGVSLVVSDRLKNLTPQKKKSLRLALGRDRAITTAIRARGINMRSVRPVGDQVNVKTLFSFVNKTTFSDAAMKRMVADVSTLAGPAVTPVREAILGDLRAVDLRYGRFFPAGWLTDLTARLGTGSGGTIALNKSVRFRVHEVKCVDETNPEWFGSDEISWGGATVDDKGVAGIIPEKFVDNGFDDGDRKTYNPPEIIKNFPLDNVYPKEFMVTMALAEQDSGGMSEFIQKLYEAIKAELTLIIAALGAAAGAAIGIAIGGSIGTTIGGPLGTIIGVVAGAILGALIGWLVSALRDDIFEPQASSLFLSSADDTFSGGSLVSPRQSFHYRDHGGHYLVRYDWEIIK